MYSRKPCSRARTALPLPVRAGNLPATASSVRAPSIRPAPSSAACVNSASSTVTRTDRAPPVPAPVHHVGVQLLAYLGDVRGERPLQLGQAYPVAIGEEGMQ